MTETRLEATSALALVAVVCAVVATGFVVRRELTDNAITQITPPSRPPVLVDSFARLAQAGHRVGTDNAPLEIVVFSDVECSACGWFAETVYPQLKASFGDSIAVIYRHWPLERHRFALDGAIAIECAAAQGKFASFHRVIYEQQKLLGVKKFSEFAKEGGVENLQEFERCMKDSSVLSVVDRDTKAAASIGATGTPTIVMNGWHFPGGARLATLDSAARSLMSSTGR